MQVFFKACESILSSLAAISLMAMMTITFIDVLGRYAFGSPLAGAYELIEYLLPVLVFSGLPLVTQRREHVTTGLFEDRFSGWVLRVRAITINTAGAIACGYATYAMYRSYSAAATLHEASPVLGIPKPPVLGLIVAMLAITTVLLLTLAVNSFRANGRRPEQVEAAEVSAINNLGRVDDRQDGSR